MQLKASQFLTSYRFIMFLIVLGAILRLKLYWENCSFSKDEAWVAVNIMGRSWAEMFQSIPRLNDWPNRPLAFSLVEKLITSIWGNHEYAFRLFPCIAGMASMIVFYRFLRNIVPTGVLSLALAFFALCGPLIYYSAQVKQFSIDVLATLLLYCLFSFLQRKNFERGCLWFLGLGGCLAMWFSYSSVFVLAALGIVLVIKFFINKQWDKMRTILGICLLWFLNFILIYLIVIRYTITYERLLSYWQRAFMPTPFWTPQSMAWLAQALLGLQKILFESPFPSAVIGLWLIGMAVVFKRQKEQFLMLFLPIVFSLLASAWHKYPFEERFLLFLVPAWLIFTSEGIFFLIRKANKAAGVFVPLVIALLFFSPVTSAVDHSIHHRCSDENREAFKFLANHLQPGDMLFFNHNAESVFLYYSSYFHLQDKISPAGGLKEGAWIKGVKVGRFYNALTDFRLAAGGLGYIIYVYNQEGFFRESLIEQDSQRILFNKEFFPSAMRYPRVWVFLSSIKPQLKEFILESLDQNGKRLDTFEGQRAAMYLYDSRSLKNRQE